MLAIQAVSVHNAAMECLRRAMIFDASMKISDIYLKHAAKLFQIFIRQSEVMSSDKRSSWRKSPEE
jgi:chorismate mutase